MSTWPVTWEPPRPEGDPDPALEALIDLAEQLAVRTLRMLTLNRVGTAPVTVVPSRDSTCHALGRDHQFMTPYMADGKIYNHLCRLGGEDPATLILPPPVVSVVEIRVNGEVLDPSSYFVLDGYRLVRSDGVWPSAPTSLTITYQRSYPVSAAGSFAAGVLATEYLNMLQGRRCRLPSGVTSITRQGVSMEIAPGSFPDGFTGIQEVDAFIYGWNPTGRRAMPMVLSDEVDQVDQVTWRG